MQARSARCRHTRGNAHPFLRCTQCVCVCVCVCRGVYLREVNERHNVTVVALDDDGTAAQIVANTQALLDAGLRLILASSTVAVEAQRPVVLAASNDTHPVIFISALGSTFVSMRTRAGGNMPVCWRRAAFRAHILALHCFCCLCFCCICLCRQRRLIH
ncbi:hypothetical protein EON66_05745 [archaeon]|nr:MAG: hypothetical protein EON66_05745 [archaeon]